MAPSTNRFELLSSQKEMIKTITGHLRNRKNLHIYGIEGTGKSFLLDWIYDNWKEIDDSLIPIYCRSSRTLRQIFLHICGFLLYHFKHLESIDKFKRIKEIKSLADIKKLNIRTLRNIIFPYILQDNFCVILDHLEYVTPKINSFLTVLYERAPVISASRQSWEITDYSFLGNLSYCLYLTPKLKVENLSRQDTFLLIKKLAGDTIKVSGNVFKDIYHMTKGNPGLTKKIVAKAYKPEYRTRGTINLNLIMLDIKIEGTNKERRSLDWENLKQ
jgi:hypothetical protein